VIFPVLSGLLSWRHAPVAWLLVFFNIGVLGFTSYAGLEAQQGLDDLMKTKFFLNAQGRVYAQYVDHAGAKEYPEFLKELAAQVESGQLTRVDLLGQLAFRDPAFIGRADSMDYEGDQVAFKYWKRKIHDVKGYQEEHPSFTLGLSSEDPSLSKWISYIFVHSGFLHLIGNMLFLVIFGAALERQVGGLAFLVVFLLSGVIAAGTFAIMTGVTSSPLVGASGAVSGIMALYCFLNWNRAERYFYWFFLPFKGFMGFVYLPAWVALILWAVNDLSGYMGTLPELGGVAYTAHLGGEMAGVLTGAILFALRRRWPLVDRADQNVPVGKLYPWLR
jgi:membrane associated rhomboid family serine protease